MLAKLAPKFLSWVRWASVKAALAVAAVIAVLGMAVFAVEGVAAAVGGGGEGRLEVLLRVLFGLLGVGLFYVIFRLAVRALLPSDEEKWLEQAIPDYFNDLNFAEYINKGIISSYSRYSQFTLVVFRRLLTNKARLIRASEYAQPALDAISIAAMMDFVLTDDERDQLNELGEETILVPVMTPKKGTLLDNFEISDCSGSTVATLSQRETMGILAHVVSSMFRVTFFEPGAKSTKKATRALKKREREARTQILKLVCSRGVKKEEEVTASFNEAINGFISTNELIEGFRAFCEFFASNYLIIAEVPLPAGNHVTVKYRKSIPVHGRPRTAITRRRVRSGLMPYRFEVETSLPFLTPSYHFRVSGPSGQFVSSHFLMDVETKGELDQRAFEEDGRYPYLRVRYKGALPYGHLYMRGLHEFTPRRLATVVEFDEIPPGALGSARSVSVVTTLLVAAFAFILARKSGLQSNADLSAFLLAGPALAASWVGHSLERMQRSSLSTYFGLLFTAMVSLSAALLYVVQTKTGWLVHSVDPDVRDFTFLPEVDVAWVILGLLSFAMSMYLHVVLRGKQNKYLEVLN